MRIEYYTDHVAGRKLTKASSHGAVVVTKDGRLVIEPEDDYYHGELTREESVRLAHAILAANQAPDPKT